MARNIRESRELFCGEDLIVWGGKTAEKEYLAVFNISEKELDLADATKEALKPVEAGLCGSSGAGRARKRQRG
ncbi:MAG: hypothetical protein K6E50_12595 [Lachnospiraceae bacterium]|nr:hypothetical protein [Lachnospiraceae bacterium]